MKKELYTWQTECLNRWFSNGCRGIIQAVTGSGKTLMALTAASRLDKKLSGVLHIKIVVPSSSLMWQWNRSLREFIGESEDYISSSVNMQQLIGLRGNGCKSSPGCKYMIYIINSARYELARQILSELKNGGSVLLIADECHHYVSGQNHLIFEFLPYIKEYESRFFSLGLTATLPSGQAQQTLASVLGKKLYTYGIAKATALHTVCQYDIFHIELSFQKNEQIEYDEITEQLRYIYLELLQSYPFLSKMESKERFELLKCFCNDKNPKAARLASSYIRLTYKRTNLVCLASSRIICACELIARLQERLAPEERILIFGERISQAEELFSLLQYQYPERVGKYHSKMSPQAAKNALERFRTGDIRILVTCKSMDEGVDVPDASIGIVLSGTSTKRQRIQRLGRIIRKKEGKKRAVLYYFHLEHTCEDSFFLPDSSESQSFDLKFYTDTQEFSHPVYDAAAEKLLQKMQRINLDNRQIKEAERCLWAGCIRTDWLLELNEIEKQIQDAKYMRDKNYWICMKKLKTISKTHVGISGCRKRGTALSEYSAPEC